MTHPELHLGSQRARRAVTIAAALCLAFCPFVTTAFAQDAAQRRQAELIAYLKITAEQMSARAVADVKTRQDWERARAELKRQFMFTMGLDPLPDRSPLQPQVTGAIRADGFRVEKLVFQSMPGLYVTGNVYVPDQPGGDAAADSVRWPTVLYVCGHSPHPLGAKSSYQDRALWFVRHGYLCLVLDTLEFGELAGVHHGLHDLNRWHWLSRGYTPAGVEVWNAMRAIDYLESRPDVDRARIGITGISGGGAVSWYAAAADERIAVAVPVCGTFTFGSQAQHWRAAGQCDCIYYHNTFLSDLSVVGALIAPRPLLICSGQHDLDFPPDGYHAVFQSARRIYSLYADDGSAADAPPRVEEVDDNVGHADSPRLRAAARRWMNQWLRHEPASPDVRLHTEEQLFTAEQLACLEHLPDDALNYRIDEVFVPTAAPHSSAGLPAWRSRREQVLASLKEFSFRWLPTEKCDLSPRAGQRSGGWAEAYADYQDVEIQSEPGVAIRVQLLKARERRRERPLLVYAKRRDDSIYPLDLDELLPLLGRCDVAILHARLTEHSLTAAEFADIERTAAWIGRTIAAMQVWDVVRAIDWLSADPTLNVSSVAVYGQGDMGVVALYAAALDPRIGHVILRDAPLTHRRGPAVLNVLRFTDIPEVAALLAPRRLSWLGDEVPAALAPTRAIYDLYGEGDHCRSAGSLPEAMTVWKY